MKDIQRRDKMKIYGDLLLILLAEEGNEIVITHIQRKINVPYNRLKKYISELSELELIEDEISLKVTKKGKQYLDEYEAVLEFMKHMGLSYK